jgi:hypothetical protein
MGTDATPNQGFRAKIPHNQSESTAIILVNGDRPRLRWIYCSAFNRRLQV